MAKFETAQILSERGAMKSDIIQICTTTAQREEAQALAQALLRERLAACVQILGPIQSLYHWQGKLEQAEEWLLLAKTKASLFPQAQEMIRRSHSYDVPEIIAIPILYADEAYYKWLQTELQPVAKDETKET